MAPIVMLGIRQGLGGSRLAPDRPDSDARTTPRLGTAFAPSPNSRIAMLGLRQHLSDYGSTWGFPRHARAPTSAGEEAQADGAHIVVRVGVQEGDRLPFAERQLAASDGHGHRGRHE